MHSESLKTNHKRKKRELRVRKQCRGTQSRPRLCVYKSNNNISAQIINDDLGMTLVSLGTLSTELKGTEFSKKTKESAREIGKRLAEQAKQKEITSVVFDRGRFKYHGLVAALADGAREAGLQF